MPQKYPDRGDFTPESQLDKVDPWVNFKPDCKRQTGGDWYRLFLSASLGKKTLHGVNTAPSMEVLGKVPIAPDENSAVGFIRFEDRTVKPDLLGSRISDKFYAGHHYRGGQTKSGAFVAFDEGSWEPSLRTRARSSALLAAGIAAHGGSRAGALKTASIITSDDVDAEAVASTLLPASHLKREMTTVSKTSHLVFSQGTLQQGITWDDTRISLNQYAPHVAYDWGRITAIARYIAEANIQICPRFRQAAKGLGIAYHVARNAWAEVSTEDFQLSPEMFEAVPHINLEAVGVPSIKGAYLDHDQEVFVAFTRFLNTEPLNPTTDAYRGLVHLQRATRARQAKRQRVKIAHISDIDDAEAEVHAHMLTANEVRSLLKSSVSPLDFLATAVNTRWKNDVIFKTAVERYMNDTEEPSQELVDHTCKLVYNTATWIFAGGAAKEAAKKIEDKSLHGKAHDLLLTQLSTLKADLFGVASHVDTTVIFTDEAMPRLRESLRDTLSRARKATPIPKAAHYEFLTPAVEEASMFVSTIGEKTAEILSELRNDAAKAYKKAAMLSGQDRSSVTIQQTANYLMTSVAIKTLGLRTCLLRHTGYIDGSVPKETYVYKAAKKLQEKFTYGKPKLRFSNHVNAQHVADDIDQGSDLEYSVKAAVAHTTQILDYVIGELSIGKVYKAPEDLFDNAIEDVTVHDSPKYDTQELDEEAELAQIEALLAEADDQVMAVKVDVYSAVLKSYPDEATAERYAQLNDFSNLREAVKALGYGAMNDDDNKFVLTAVSRMDPKERPERAKKKAAKRGYEPML